MNLNTPLYIVSFCTLLLFSCEKEELPVTAHHASNVTTASINMDANYKWQIFYDLKTNTVVRQNIKTSWDIGFETTTSGYRIILNTSKAMFASNTGNTNFSITTDTNGFSANKKWDEPSGNPDSTAIGDWRVLKSIYMIDRGYNETGAHMGFRKIQFQEVDENKYTIRLSELNGTGDVTLQINKDDRYNFTFLSFDNGGQPVVVEPPKTDWDLCFTQYTHIFYNPTLPYLVTGCLLNRYHTAAVMDSLKAFTRIDFSGISNYTFSSNINTIGYDWKAYTGGVYVTYPQINYIIKDSEGFYYKLHFIDFYNNSGAKGNPKWEYQKL